MGQKDRRRNTGETKRKRKRKQKQGRIFGLLKIGNLTQIIFDLKILQNICKSDLVLFISLRRIKW
jgi:hypothetical protein